MANQLSLFPSTERSVEETAVGVSDINALDEMFAASPQYRLCGRYRQMLAFIARFPQYSAFNGFLMYIQNPGARYVANAAAWRRRFDRRPLPDARPMVILAPMAPVLFMYDIADTQGRDLDSDALRPAALRDRQLREIFDKTVENCSVHGIAVRYGKDADRRRERVAALTYAARKQYADLSPDPQSSYLIVLDADSPLTARYASLVCNLGHVFCGHLGIDGKAWWPDRRNQDPSAADLEAASVSFLVLQRKAISDAAQDALCGWADPDGQLPNIGLSAVFQATQYIEDMGKSVWRFPRKKSRYL